MTYLWLLTVLAPAAYAAAGLHYPGLPLTSWLERVPAGVPANVRTAIRVHLRRLDFRPVFVRAAARIHGWLYPATGQHCATVLRLGLDGLWHGDETGPFTIPDGYGRIGEGTVMAAVDRMWRGL